MRIGFLETNGLSLEILEGLSYRSNLGKSLKNNLNAFPKGELLTDAITAAEWMDMNELLAEVAIDYRIKSEESIRSKYERYYPDRPVMKTFNDILGFRSCCDDYREVLAVSLPQFKVVDMSHGKARDDGYRGVHLYYQPDNFHYPIELQFNTLYDRQLNNWLHDYLYKKAYPNRVGRIMRQEYEHGSYTLKTTHGVHLAELKKSLNKEAVPKGIQLVTISRPNAYGEYAPYQIVKDEEEFIQTVKKLCQ